MNIIYLFSNNYFYYFLYRTRHSIGPSNLTSQSQKKFSKSAYELDSISKAGRVDRSKSSSLHNLDKERTLTRAHARNERERSHTHQLQNIEESYSASDNENDSDDREHNRRRNVTSSVHRGVSPAPHKSEMSQRMHKSSSKSKSNSPETASNHELPFATKRYMFEESHRHNGNQNNRSMSRDRSPPAVERSIRYGSEDRTLRRGEGSKPPLGPPKPARNIDRRRGLSRFE